MIIKDVVQIGNPVLKAETKEITDFKSKETQKVIDDLVDSVRHYDLIGMAAPQIGVSLKIFVTEVRETKFRGPDDVDELKVYINPKIVELSSDEVEIYEGCGSVAYSKFFAPVIRPKKVKIDALNRSGERFVVEADGLLSRVIQHEYDHLEGIEFIEKISDISRAMSSEEYIKMIRNN